VAHSRSWSFKNSFVDESRTAEREHSFQSLRPLQPEPGCRRLSSKGASLSGGVNRGRALEKNGEVLASEGTRACRYFMERGMGSNGEIHSDLIPRL
jgi:hypothetical protein